MKVAADPVIRFDSCSKAFSGRKVLDAVTFEVRRGEILFVLGRSGMGKSVTLKHIIGMMQPDSGRVQVLGRDLPDGLQEVRRRCGMVFQQPALIDSLTVLENVGFGLRHLPPAEIRSRVLEVMDRVRLGDDLPGILDKLPAALSYGMQKRVSLARTLAPRPEILLFDEPTTGLDPITTRAINRLIEELSRSLAVTSVVVSHDMGCALEIADRILVLDEGRILALGTVDEIRRHPSSLIREFLAEELSR